jgi:hypothetical protein
MAVFYSFFCRAKVIENCGVATVFPSCPDDMHMCFLQLNYYETVARDEDTTVDPEVNIILNFPCNKFHRFFFTCSPEIALSEKYCMYIYICLTHQVWNTFCNNTFHSESLD